MIVRCQAGYGTVVRIGIGQDMVELYGQVRMFVLARDRVCMHAYLFICKCASGVTPDAHSDS